MTTNELSGSKDLPYLQLRPAQAEVYTAKADELESLIAPGSTTDSWIIYDHDAGEWGVNVGAVDGPRFTFHIPGSIGAWGCNTTAQERRVLGLYYADRGVTGTVHVMRKGKAGDAELKIFQKDRFPQKNFWDALVPGATDEQIRIIAAQAIADGNL